MIVHDEEEFTLSDAILRNGARLELFRVKRVRLDRILVSGDGSPQHNINLKDCPDAILNDIQSNRAGGLTGNGSRMGCGIHYNGKTGCQINRVLCQGNTEDAIMMGNSTTGFVRVSHAHFISNGEDGCDIKNGSMYLTDAVIDQRTGALHHCVIVHDGDGSNMAARQPTFFGQRVMMLGHDSSQIIRCQYGFAQAIDCEFWKPSDSRWFESGGTVYDKVLDLDTDMLSVADGRIAGQWTAGFRPPGDHSSAVALGRWSSPCLFRSRCNPSGRTVVLGSVRMIKRSHPCLRAGGP